MGDAVAERLTPSLLTGQNPRDAALAVMALGIVLLPVYAWVMWRDSKALREARNAGLIP